ncbi:MAG: phosphate/phosphite/phosphonate ABC transporter substrate-binding protein [Gammaproteobacteria bacterium]|nr:phosphate/phosphite/phosphonate ABC transporter substrate-binding protein [Gammaproteobacteria bacterium]
MKTSASKLAFSIMVIIIFFTLFFTSETKAEQKTVYTIGIVPQYETQRLHAIWRPIITLLEQRTGLKFKLRGSPTIPDFEREFLQGKFDFAYMNPYHVLLANKTQGYKPLIRDHGRQLYGVLVTKKDGPIENIKDLDGKTIAFPAPNALGASLLMRADLQNIHHINIKPKYVKTHDSVYLSIALNQAAAGGGVQKTFNNQSQQIRDILRVLYTTRKVAPHPFTAHPRVPGNVATHVQKTLQAMGEDEQGKKLLSQIPIKQIGTASMDDYKPLSSMGLEKFYIKN